MSDLIGRKMALGAMWLILVKFSVRGLGLISTLILARLLAPSDFGLVAMAMTIISLLELLGAFSFDVVLIQNQSATDTHYNTAWTFKVILSSVTTLFIILMAYPTASFYNEPRLENIIYVLALGTFIRGFENIGTVNFRKEMNFQKEFNYSVIQKVAAFAVTVPLAFYLRNHWALIAGTLMYFGGGTVISYLMHPYRPRFSLAARKEIFNFSKWLFANNLLYYFKERSADFIIGKVSGPVMLGFYEISYEISNLPTTELVAPINRAIFPGYSKRSSDLSALRKDFISVISLIAIFALPAGLGISATADLIVSVALGKQWLNCIPLIKLLAIFGAVIAVQTNIQSIYLSLAKPKILTMLALLYVALLIPALVGLTLVYGIIGAAVANLLTATICLFVNYTTLFKVISLNCRKLVDVIWRPVLAALGMFLTVTVFLKPFLESGHGGGQASTISDLLLLLVAVALGMLSYSVYVSVLWIMAGHPDGSERLLIEKTKSLMVIIKTKLSDQKIK